MTVDYFIIFLDKNKSMVLISLEFTDAEWLDACIALEGAFYVYTCIWLGFMPIFGGASC